MIFSIRKIECRQDRFPGQARMRVKDLLNAFAGREFFQNHFDRYSRTGNDWFAHRDRGIRFD
jgi:hypothetical protein